MRVRKLGVLIAIVMVALGLYAPQASAGVPVPPRQVCIVQGKVSFKATQLSYAPPALPGSPYPVDPTLYNFVGVGFVCAGLLMTGVCDATSHGDTSPVPGQHGGFKGDYQVTCSDGSSCTGLVGGTRASEPPTVGELSGLDWSYTRAPLIAGSISASCSTGAGSGILLLVGVPDPRLPITVSGPADVNGDGVPDIGVHYDCIIVAGVAIIG